MSDELIKAPIEPEVMPPDQWEVESITPGDTPNDDPIIINLRDPNGWWKVFVKWDGCVELTHYTNVPFTQRKSDQEDDCDDSIHICDLDDYIERLKGLAVEIRKHFPKGWPG